MAFFDLIDLFAERRLGEVQSIGSPGEVQLFGQDNDCAQVTHFNAGYHCFNSFRQTAEFSECPIYGKEPPEGAKHHKMFMKLVRFLFWGADAKGGPASRRRR